MHLQCMIQAETDQYAAALSKAGCNLNALRYLKRWKYYNEHLLPISHVHF